MPKHHVSGHHAFKLENLESRVLMAADPITPDHPLWTIPRGAAEIDGVLDDFAWDSAHIVRRTQATRDDRAVTVRMMYNDFAIFLAAEVEDRNLWADGTGSGAGNRWEVETDDSVTFYFDQDNSRDNVLQAGDRALGVNLGNVTHPLNGSGIVRRYKFVRGDGNGGAPDVNPGGVLPDGLLYATTIQGTANNPNDTDTGWVTEICIPWAALNMAAPTHGQTMAINFDIIQDNDGGQRNLTDNREGSNRFVVPHFIDDHVQGVHSSFSATQSGLRGPVSYAEAMFINPREGQRPAPIVNLQAANVSGYGAFLAFKSPAGTAGGAGHVSGYEIRYSRSGPIQNDRDWSAAAVYDNAFVPRLQMLNERLRLAGLTPGTQYHTAVRALDAAGNLGDLSNSVSFTTLSSTSDGSGGVRVVPSPRGDTLMREDGRPFVVVGDHLGLTWGFTRQLFPGDIWDNANGVYQNFSNHVPAEGEYEGFFDSLRDHGVNTMRVYLELQHVYFQGNPNPPQGLTWLEHNAGQFNPDMRTFMHNVLREAGERGIHIIFSPFDSFSYDEAFGQEGPWATNFGGPLTDIDNFFQNSGTLTLARNRMTTVINWANESEYSDYLIGWEPLSEWESFEWTLNAEGNGEAGRETEMRTRSVWINALAAHIKERDPTRLVLNSTIVRDPRGPVARVVFYSREWDALTPHLYTTGNTEPINNPQADTKILPAIEMGHFTSYWMTNRSDNRPVLNGEWGMTRIYWPNNRPEYSPAFTQQEDEAIFRTVMWSGFASGQVGTGLRINTEELQFNFMLLTDTMRDLQLTFSNFATSQSLPIDFTRFNLRNLAGDIRATSAAGKVLHSWGVSDGRQGIAYVLQDGNRTSGAVSDGVLTLEGLLADTIFDAEVWSTAPGQAAPLATISGVHAATGTLRLSLPGFAEDVAVKFKARTVARQTQRVVSIAVGNDLAVFALGLDGQPFATITNTLTGETSTLDAAGLAGFRGRAIDMTPFVSVDGRTNLALIDDRHHLWILTGTLAQGQAWTATDQTAASNSPGLSGELTTFQPSWQTVHAVGLDARGHVSGYFGAPGQAVWFYDDMTTRLGFEPLDGGLTSWVAPWDALNVAGLRDGEVVAYWFVPQLDWQVINFTTSFDGPRMTGQLDSFVTSWNAMNIAGRTEDGQVVALWWVPTFEERPNDWRVSDITDAAGAPPAIAGTEFGVSADGGLNIFTLAEGDRLSAIRWTPATNAWVHTDVTTDTGAPQITFPVASAAANSRLQTAAPSRGKTLVLFNYNTDTGVWEDLDTGRFVTI